MDELEKLEHLSLVSKICTELENHLGMNDKDLGELKTFASENRCGSAIMSSILAEFIIHLAEENPKLEDFQRELIKNGAEFGDSFISNLLRIILLMKPTASKKGGNQNFIEDLEQDVMSKKFPGLAIPNKFKPLEEYEKEAKPAGDSTVDDMLAELEALAPGPSKSDEKIVKEPKERKRSRSRNRDKEKRRRSRSRSRDRKKRSRSRSRDRRKRSRSRDRKHRRRSHSREKRRSRSRSRDRRNRSRSKSFDRRPDKKKVEMKDDPELGGIYDGKVQNITNFGCFVQLMGLRKKCEGLVHISQLRSEGRVTDVSEVVSRGDSVKVKVMSIAGVKVSLSMKEVDQLTGTDLNPLSHKPPDEDCIQMRNPDRPSGGEMSMLSLPGNYNENDDTARKRVTRISSPERWEIKQMISSGVIDRSEMPDFDEETGLLQKDEEDEADIEIEIVEEEPAFLTGHGRALHDLEPVRIVKNPDGSLAQAAMMQSALAKERREQKMLARDQEMDSKPNLSGKNFLDPLPDEVKPDYEMSKSAMMPPQDVPEWKKVIIGGKKTSYGRKTDMSIVEQRQSLPIFKLRDELLKAVNDNQILIVIGETGSGKVSSGEISLISVSIIIWFPF